MPYGLGRCVLIFGADPVASKRAANWIRTGIQRKIKMLLTANTTRNLPTQTEAQIGLTTTQTRSFRRLTASSILGRNGLGEKQTKSRLSLGYLGGSRVRGSSKWTASQNEYFR
jgi:hypothetical protein